MPIVSTLGFGGGGVDDAANLGDAVGGEAALAGVLADHLFVGRDVDAVDFVVGDVAMKPLDLGTEIAQDGAGFFSDGLRLLGRYCTDTWNFAFNDELWHGTTSLQKIQST